MFFGIKALRSCAWEKSYVPKPVAEDMNKKSFKICKYSSLKLPHKTLRVDSAKEKPRQRNGRKKVRR